MASHRGLRVLVAMLFSTLVGCAEQAPTTAQAPASPPPPAAATSPSGTPAPAPSKPPAIASSPQPSPPASAPAPREPSKPASREFVEEPALKDVFFDPGHAEIGHQGALIMKSNAGWLIEHATLDVLIEGHSDWKGTADANMAVGERRAMAAKSFLVKAGISESRIQIVSLGSDRPVCAQKTEACAARNRRVHFLVKSR